MIKIAEAKMRNIDVINGEEIVNIIKKNVKYSDKGKLLVDEKGTRYITAWEKENVTETDEDIDKATFDEVMRELGVSIH